MIVNNVAENGGLEHLVKLRSGPDLSRCRRRNLRRSVQTLLRDSEANSRHQGEVHQADSWIAL